VELANAIRQLEERWRVGCILAAILPVRPCALPVRFHLLLYRGRSTWLTHQRQSGLLGSIKVSTRWLIGLQICTLLPQDVATLGVEAASETAASCESTPSTSAVGDATGADGKSSAQKLQQRCAAWTFRPCTCMAASVWQEGCALVFCDCRNKTFMTS